MNSTVFSLLLLVLSLFFSDKFSYLLLTSITFIIRFVTLEVFPLSFWRLILGGRGPFANLADRVAVDGYR